MGIRKIVRSCRAVLGALVVLGLAGCTAGTDEDKISNIENASLGRDPHAYPEAAQMYSSPPVIRLDDAGRELLKKIDTMVRTNPGAQRSAEADAWWLGLAELNPYRANPEVQEALAQWAQRCAENARTSGEPPDAAAFEEGNRLYREGKFGPASMAYARLLVQCPAHLDARNNLALAQLHKGNDLIAQLQWEILCRLSDRYVPARINLTVVYERLGRRAEAQKMADAALAQGGEVPAAVFNAAWLKDVAGEGQRAEELLRPMAALGAYPRIVEFHRMLARRTGQDDAQAATEGGGS